jgi:predicted nuclease of predicted toxin-antitoxin system
LRFLIDAQLPPAMARALSDLGHDAAHVSDIGLRSSSDAAIWKEAQRLNAVIITKDEDFVAGNPGRFGLPAPPVIWIRIGNASRQSLLSFFLPLLPQMVTLVEAGETIVEIRRP